MLPKMTGRRLSDAELMVAEQLLELAFGPGRVHGMVHVEDAQADPRLAPVREGVDEAMIESALAVPLVAREELVGLLAAYLPRGRELTANESSLLSALGNQLAVAAQNAQLHERTERLASEREEALGGTGGGEAPARPLRDLTLVRPEPVARHDPRRRDERRRRAAGSRCGGDQDAGRPR